MGIPLHKRRIPLPASGSSSLYSYTPLHTHSDYLDIHFPIDRSCEERDQEREPPKARDEVVPADLFITIHIESLEQLLHLSKAYGIR